MASESDFEIAGITAATLREFFEFLLTKCATNDIDENVVKIMYITDPRFIANSKLRAKLDAFALTYNTTVLYVSMEENIADQMEDTLCNDCMIVKTNPDVIDTFTIFGKYANDDRVYYFGSITYNLDHIVDDLADVGSSVDEILANL